MNQPNIGNKSDHNDRLMILTYSGGTGKSCELKAFVSSEECESYLDKDGIMLFKKDTSPRGKWADSKPYCSPISFHRLAVKKGLQYFHAKIPLTVGGKVHASSGKGHYICKSCVNFDYNAENCDSDTSIIPDLIDLDESDEEENDEDDI